MVDIRPSARWRSAIIIDDLRLKNGAPADQILFAFLGQSRVVPESSLLDNRAGKIRPRQVGEGQTRLVQIGIFENRAAEVRVAEIAITQIRLRQIRPAQIRTAQIRQSQTRPVQIGAAQIGVAQQRPAEVRPAQIHFPQVGAAEVGVAQIHAPQVGFLQVRAAEIRVAQVGSQQSGAGEVGGGIQPGQFRQFQKVVGFGIDNRPDRPLQLGKIAALGGGFLGQGLQFFSGLIRSRNFQF